VASREDKPSNKRKAPAKAKAAAKSKAAAKPRTARRRAPTHEAIAKRAYELSQVDDGGDVVSNWLRAERELTGS
jgi:hypothetical protein